MSRIYKSLNISLISLFVFLLLVLLLASLLIIKSIPDYNRVVTNSLVNDDVEVYRNKFAIPNIVGKTNDDSFFALGYVHAQDRLWQMILLRKTAKGKLAELFGDKYLKTDKFVRTLDIYNSSKKSVDYLTNNTKSLLISYSNGINKRLLDIQKEGLGRGSPNLFLFPPKITPWTPADSLAILKFYDLLNNDSAKNEVIRLNLLNFGLPFNKLLDLYPDLPDISKNYKSINKIIFSKKKTDRK